MLPYLAFRFGAAFLTAFFRPGFSAFSFGVYLPATVSTSSNVPLIFRGCSLFIARKYSLFFDHTLDRGNLESYQQGDEILVRACLDPRQ